MRRCRQPKGLSWLPRSTNAMCASRGWYCCCTQPPCLHCSGVPPDTLEVTFAGVVNGLLDCTDCAAYYNNSFILERTGGAEGDLCHYDFAEEGIMDCDPGPGVLDVNIYLRYDAANTLQVYIKDYNWAGLQMTVIFKKVFGAEPPCEPAAPVAVPFLSQTIAWTCDWAAATCSVDAAP